MKSYIIRLNLCFQLRLVKKKIQAAFYVVVLTTEQQLFSFWPVSREYHLLRPFMVRHTQHKGGV